MGCSRVISVHIKYKEDFNMIDLRNYKDLIRELVAKENDKDKNWRW